MHRSAVLEVARFQSESFDCCLRKPAPRFDLLIRSHHCTDNCFGLSPDPVRPRSRQSRPQESEQDDKWSFCLTAGTLCQRIRRDDEQTTAPEPYTGVCTENLIRVDDVMESPKLAE
jgi:hypothetical protein